MTPQSSVLLDRKPSVDEGLHSVVATFVTADETPLSDLPVPGEINNAALLLLAGLLLLGPNQPEEPPVERSARAALQDLDFAWSF